MPHIWPPHIKLPIWRERKWKEQRVMGFSGGQITSWLRRMVWDSKEVSLRVSPKHLLCNVEERPLLLPGSYALRRFPINTITFIYWLSRQPPGTQWVNLLSSYLSLVRTWSQFSCLISFPVNIFKLACPYCFEFTLARIIPSSKTPLISCPLFCSSLISLCMCLASVPTCFPQYTVGPLVSVAAENGHHIHVVPSKGTSYPNQLQHQTQAHLTPHG